MARPKNMALWTSKDWKENWQEAVTRNERFRGTKVFSKRWHAHLLAQVHKCERKMKKGE